MAWGSAGGGYVQFFEQGWALIPSAGKGGATIGQGAVLTGAALTYFRAHGTVTNVGWPSGAAGNVLGGTWQNFISNGNSVHGAISTSSKGVFTVKGAIYDFYKSGSLAGAYGAATSETPYALPGTQAHPWASHGGGYAQYFSGGMVSVSNSGKKGAVLSALLPYLDIASRGWPSSTTFNQCGGLKVWQENGQYSSSNNRWCPGQAYAQPVTSVSRVAMPSSLTSASGGDAGINVMLVQRKLGVAPSNSFSGPSERISGTTVSKLASKRSSLGGGYSATIDQWLWGKLGITTPWSTPTTTQQPSLSLSATRQQRVDAMISFAKRQTKANGVAYTYGSAGPMSYGVDCSGLVLAALQYAGVPPKSASVRDDMIHPTKLTQALYNDSSLIHAPLSSRQPGDLIFYSTNGAASGIGHVAIYLGGGMVFDTENNGYEGKVRTLNEPAAAGLSLYPTVSRPIQ